MDAIRDVFGRIVPGNLIVRFRDRPQAVCPLCDGQGVRKADKSMVLCGTCGGDGALTQQKIERLDPAILEVCKAHGRPDSPEPIPVLPSPHPNGTHKNRRKSEPETVST